MRRPEGFRFVCPILWGQDASAPAEQIPGGDVAIGGVTGLYVLDADGVVDLHPDPDAASGQVVALARSATALFGLRYREGVVEVMRVEKDRLEVVWSSEERFQDLAAGDDYLALARVDGSVVHALRLTPKGELLASESALIAEPGSVAWARPLGDELQIVVVAASLESELGRIDGDAWDPILRAISLAGPIELEDGSRLVGVEGVLYAYEDDELRELDATSGAECLREHEGIVYACSQGNLRELEDSAFGKELFRLDEVGPPDLELVSEELRSECELQWQRYVLLDLGMRGIEPRMLEDGDDAAADAGLDAGLGPDASNASDAGKQPKPRPQERSTGSSSGCQAVTAARENASPVWLAFSFIALAFGRLRRRARI